MASVLLAAGAAPGDERTELEKAYSAYVGHKYDDAEARLRALLAAGALKDPDTVADARMYLGAVLVALGRRPEAGALFEALMVDRPEYEPDPLRVSTDAIDAFLDVRARIRARLASLKAERARVEQEARARAEADRRREAARVALLEKLASEEVVRRPSSRWIALLPFGVGQFQNGNDALGGVLLAAEAAMILGSGISAGLAVYDARQANDALARLDPTDSTYQKYAWEAAWSCNFFTAGFALLAVAGAVEAEINFVPERVQVRKRALPPGSSAAVSPVFSLTGVGLRF